MAKCPECGRECSHLENGIHIYNDEPKCCICQKTNNAFIICFECNPKIDWFHFRTTGEFKLKEIPIIARPFKLGEKKREILVTPDLHIDYSQETDYSFPPEPEKTPEPEKEEQTDIIIDGHSIIENIGIALGIIVFFFLIFNPIIPEFMGSMSEFIGPLTNNFMVYPFTILIVTGGLIALTYFLLVKLEDFF